MELNEYECGMLDALLKAFDDKNTLDAQQMQMLFVNQEQLLLELINVLVNWKLVTPFGHDAASGLPLLLRREKHALYFMENGGFSGSIQEKTTFIQQEAERLREREERIEQLEKKIKDLNQQHSLLWIFLALALVVAVVIFLLHYIFNLV
ncbi:MAG: hypothetical protein ACTHNW_12390 [Mucilaginibacter sp.]